MHAVVCVTVKPSTRLLEGGREEGRKGGREEGRKGGREEGRKGGRKEGRKGGKDNVCMQLCVLL